MLRPGGWLFVEEEFPIDQAATPPQEVWAEKWRLLKAATVAGGGSPYTEFHPQDLADLCRLAGLGGVEWSADKTIYQGAGILDFFQARLERLLPRLPNDVLRAGFAK